MDKLVCIKELLYRGRPWQCVPGRIHPNRSDRNLLNIQSTKIGSIYFLEEVYLGKKTCWYVYDNKTYIGIVFSLDNFISLLYHKFFNLNGEKII